MKHQAIRNIMAELDKRIERLNIKITSMSLAIYHMKMYTLVDIDKELIKDFEQLDRMIGSVEKLNKEVGLNIRAEIKSFHNTIKKMSIKTLYIKTSMANEDFRALKVVTLDYLSDVNKLKELLNRMA